MENAKNSENHDSILQKEGLTSEDKLNLNHDTFKSI